MLIAFLKKMAEPNLIYIIGSKSIKSRKRDTETMSYKQHIEIQDETQAPTYCG